MDSGFFYKNIKNVIEWVSICEGIDSVWTFFFFTTLHTLHLNYLSNQREPLIPGSRRCTYTLSERCFPFYSNSVAIKPKKQIKASENRKVFDDLNKSFSETMLLKAANRMENLRKNLLFCYQLGYLHKGKERLNASLNTLEPCPHTVQSAGNGQPR